MSVAADKGNGRTTCRAYGLVILSRNGAARIDSGRTDTGVDGRIRQGLTGPGSKS